MELVCSAFVRCTMCFFSGVNILQTKSLLFKKFTNQSYCYKIMLDFLCKCVDNFIFVLVAVAGYKVSLESKILWIS